MEDIVFTDKYDAKIRIYKSQLRINNNIINECKICLDDTLNNWSITFWHTNESYKHQGYGAKNIEHILKALYNKFGEPESIRYVWNGENEYVLDWLKLHFDPVSKLPIAVQKYQECDDWDNHIYILNKEKVLNYYEIG